MGICLNINAWMYMLPLGLGGAVNTSVSNALGAGALTLPGAQLCM